MYNGIGLPTPRGSGTNGYVKRNLAHVKKSRQMKVDIVSQPDTDFDKPPNFEILIHQKKRHIEAKCLRLLEELRAEGWSEDKVQREVDGYRNDKLYELSKISEQDQSDRIKRSFGIKNDYVDGSSVTQMKRNSEIKNEIKEEAQINEAGTHADEIKVKAEPDQGLVHLDKKLKIEVKQEDTDENRATKRKRDYSERDRKRRRRRSVSSSSSSSSSSTNSSSSSNSSPSSSTDSSSSDSSSAESCSSSSTSSSSRSYHGRRELTPKYHSNKHSRSRKRSDRRSTSSSSSSQSTSSTSSSSSCSSCSTSSSASTHRTRSSASSRKHRRRR